MHAPLSSLQYTPRIAEVKRLARRNAVRGPSLVRPCAVCEHVGRGVPRQLCPACATLARVRPVPWPAAGLARPCVVCEHVGRGVPPWHGYGSCRGRRQCRSARHTPPVGPRHASPVPAHRHPGRAAGPRACRPRRVAWSARRVTMFRPSGGAGTAAGHGTHCTCGYRHFGVVYTRPASTAGMLQHPGTGTACATAGGHGAVRVSKQQGSKLN